jgi:hypothetical protein
MIPALHRSERDSEDVHFEGEHDAPRFGQCWASVQKVSGGRESAPAPVTHTVAAAVPAGASSKIRRRHACHYSPPVAVALHAQPSLFWPEGVAGGSYDYPNQDHRSHRWRQQASLSVSTFQFQLCNFLIGQRLAASPG